MTAETTSPDRQRIMRIAQEYVWLGSRVHRWAERRSPVRNSYGLTLSQMSGLYLIQNGLVTAGAIAKEMQITPRAVTSIVDVLVAKELVSREVDTVDRRRALLQLTPLGFEVSKAIEETALLPLRDFLAGQSLEEIETLEQLLEMIAKFVEAIPSLEN